VVQQEANESVVLHPDRVVKRRLARLQDRRPARAVEVGAPVDEDFEDRLLPLKTVNFDELEERCGPVLKTRSKNESVHLWPV
jgi:hypothetical protein